MTAATPAERKARERQRKADAGLTEVRGIYAPPDLHAVAKEAARKAITQETKTMPRTTITVEYGNKSARFSDYRDAMHFARDMSNTHPITEVSDKTGLIGQFVGGITTDEFRAHWAAVAH